MWLKRAVVLVGVMVCGAIGGLVAVNATSHPPKVALVQRASEDAKSQTTTPAPTTTTVAPPTTSTTYASPTAAATSAAQSAQSAAQSATQAAASASTAQQAAASVTTTTTTTTVPNVTVPNVVGMTWNQAASAIEADGLVNSWTGAKCTAAGVALTPDGQTPIVLTIPAAGTEVPGGSTVDFCNMT